MASSDINQNRLNWLSNYGLSQRQIADQLNVSQSSISRWNTGESAPSIENQRLLRNLYQRTVYKSSREIGLTPEQARSASWQATKQTIAVLPSVAPIIDNLTNERAKREINRLVQAGLDYDPQTIWNEARQKIIKGFASAKISIEEIRERYGK